MNRSVQVGDGSGIDYDSQAAEICRREREDLVSRCRRYLHILNADLLPMPLDHKVRVRLAISETMEVLGEVDNNDLLRHLAAHLEEHVDEAESEDLRMGPPWPIYVVGLEFCLVIGLCLGHVLR